MYTQVLGAIVRYMLSQEDEPTAHCHAHWATAAASGSIGLVATVFRLMAGAAALLVWLAVGAVWLVVRAFRSTSSAR